VAAIFRTTTAAMISLHYIALTALMAWVILAGFIVYMLAV
jgi:hypothetical protein